jgi:hypothetical protein
MPELNSLSEDRLNLTKPIRWITDQKICHRYSIGRMTLWRWRHDPNMGFPQPTNFSGHYNRTREDQLDEFDLRRLDASKNEEVR